MVEPNERERRLHPRVDLELPVRYQLERGGRWRTATLVNLSASGAALVGNDEIPTMTELPVVQFTLPGSNDVLQVRAIVVRAQQLDDSERGRRFLAGIHFLDLGPDRFERVRAFVFERLRA